MTPIFAVFPITIERQAGFTYPIRVQGGKPVAVILRLADPNVVVNTPNPNAETDTIPLIITQEVDLEMFVLAQLGVTGGIITKHPENEEQAISDQANIWIWELTVNKETSEVTLVPELYTRYKDTNGRLVRDKDLVWHNIYTISEVVGDSPLDYIRQNLLTILSVLVGSGGIGAMLGHFFRPKTPTPPQGSGGGTGSTPKANRRPTSSRTPRRVPPTN